MTTGRDSFQWTRECEHSFLKRGDILFEKVNHISRVLDLLFDFLLDASSIIREIFDWPIGGLARIALYRTGALRMAKNYEMFSVLHGSH